MQRQLIVYDYDNLGRTLSTDAYDGDRVAIVFDTTTGGLGRDTLTGALGADSDGNGSVDIAARRSRTATSYDERGQVYQTRVYAVSQSDGTLGSNVLTTDYWYDARGQLIKTDAPGGLITKNVYDGVGRPTRTYQLDDNSADSVYGDADDVIGDVVLEQTDYAYDENDNIILTAQHERFHDAANKSGSTTESDYVLGGAGGVTGSGTSGARAARVYYTAAYYDGLNRQTASVNVGTNGSSAYTRPGSVPSRSDSVLVTSYAYDPANHRVTTTDPRGIDARTETDMLGRTIQTIAAYVDGTPSDGDDQTTQYTYTGSGDILTLKAVLPSSAIQETKYVYSEPTQTATTVTRLGSTVIVSLTAHGYKQGEMVTISGASDAAYNGTFRVASATANSFTYTISGTPTSPASGTVTVRRAQGIFSNDMLVATYYPDKSSGSASASEAERYTLNAVGERLHMTDRRGDVHDYSYDLTGRTTRDHVYTLASGVQGSVRTLEWSYDTAGRLYEATSRSSNESGQVVVNQVRRLYNDFGQLTTEYQEHAGAVDTGTTAKTQYGYTWASGTSRRTSMTYPGGKVITYGYGSSGSLDDHISRIASISDSGGTLESYKYLGLSTRIERDRPQPGTRQSFITGDTLVSGYAGDQYTGLDQFGRVVDQDWQTISGGIVTGHTDRFQYAYDRDGNVLYKNNKVSSTFSELYVTDRDTVAGSDGSYDLLNRLTAFQRGALSDVNSDGRFDSITASSRAQSWSLDALGNWSSSITDTNGDTSGGSTTTSRTNNKQNQATAVGSGSYGFDADGNLTTRPFGLSSDSLQYDAWNRLAQHASTVSYPSDALGRRVREEETSETWQIGDGNTATDSNRTDLYYSDRWQVIEEHLYSVNYNADAPFVDEITNSTYVWSSGYVDELVLRDHWDGAAASRQYAQQDANYNVTSLTGTSLTVTERFAYDPYGSATYLNGSWSTQSSSASEWVYLHQGGRWNYWLGLYHFRNREYSPTLGRWIQVDPLPRTLSGTNPYRYQSSDPISQIDAMGLVSGKDIATGGGVVVGAVIGVYFGGVPGTIIGGGLGGALGAIVGNAINGEGTSCSEIGMWVGGGLGAWIGAEIGGLKGSEIGAEVGGIIGGVVGGIVGDLIGDGIAILVDKIPWDDIFDTALGGRPGPIDLPEVPIYCEGEGFYIMPDGTVYKPLSPDEYNPGPQYPIPPNKRSGIIGTIDTETGIIKFDPSNSQTPPWYIPGNGVIVH
ncbi:MAG: RHS repeat-associated core domain-containing protein [Tepidisphaeraceae bacterium]